MMSDASPTLSVVVVAFSGPARLRRCIASLMSQPGFGDVEVHIVSRESGQHYAALVDGVANIHWHRVPENETVPTMRSLGMANSRAGLVALLEDDCTVGPNWLASLLAAHRMPYPAVGGAVEPGAYSRGLDWAVYYCEYARFLAPFSGIVGALPGNNVSYKSGSLGEGTIGDGFFDVFFHQGLRDSGADLCAAEGMVVVNDNERRLASCVSMPFHHGRAYAAQRFGAGRRPKRLLYAMLSPLLPLIKSVRTLREIVARRRPELPILKALPWIVLFHCCWSAGECLGYLAGPGNSGARWR